MLLTRAPREKGLEDAPRLRLLPVVLDERVERPEERGEARQKVARDTRGPREQQPLHLGRHALQMVAVAHGAQQIAYARMLVRSMGGEHGEQLSMQPATPAVGAKDGRPFVLESVNEV